MNRLVADRERLTRTFVNLAQIDSPSLEEAAIAKFVRAELESLGWDVLDDRTGPQVGNLLARRSGQIGSTLPVLLSTHLDVVEPCRGVRPRVCDGTIESDGSTVLGADAKAGVAALLEVARVLNEADRADLAAGLELLFTWGEEVGHRGAKAFDRSRARAKHGFVLDALMPVGSIVIAAPTYVAFKIRIQGHAAHAGVEPELGVSAIAVAARAIDRVRWGRLDDITTTNIGSIVGGSARNVVPDSVDLVGEIRSLDADRVADRQRIMVETFQAACGEFGADMHVDAEQVYAGYRLSETAPSVQQAQRAAATMGALPELASTGGGSDANEFNAAGLECCVLGIGAEACHSVHERITVSELGRLADMALAIPVGGNQAHPRGLKD
jgi:tripeptide aminopeptidase